MEAKNENKTENLSSDFKGQFKKTTQAKLMLIPINLLKTLTSEYKEYLLNLPRHPQILKEIAPNNCKKVILNLDFSSEPLEKWPNKLQKFIIDHSLVIEDYDIIKNYEDFTYHEVLQELLPKDVTIPTSFEIVGSIAHFNLQKTQLSYKNLIAQVLLDKNPAIKTVVNKTEALSNVFRTPELEILGGVPSLITEVKEGKCIFSLAYDKVYWNSKLQAERDRILDLFQENDVILDLFCGVGPLSVRAAKKGCFVVANDLNPDCYQYLQINVKKNHVESKVICFNLDAKECFQKTVSGFKDEITKKIPKNLSNFNHVYMNLPGDAISFLDMFFGFFKLCDPISWNNCLMPLIHVYSFSETDEVKSKEILAQRIQNLLPNFQKDDIIHFHTIKDVSSLKKMYGITFRLRKEDAQGILPPKKPNEDEEEKKEDFGDVIKKKIKKT